MKKWLRSLVGVVSVTGLFVLVAGAEAETCKLDIKKVEASGRVSSPLDHMFRSTSAQGFFMQIGGPEGRVVRPGDEGKPEFSTLITKEPAKYEAEHPFRGVAKLGSRYYGFVLDSAPPQKAEEKKEGEKKGTDAPDSEPVAESKEKPAPKLIPYSRLYFDLNHNGDLTDDEVIEAESTRQYAVNYAQSMFPRADLTIDVDGTEVEYAFTMRVYTHSSGEFAYANASLSAAAYREGEITLDGKKYRVVIVDFNSNGMFNDESEVSDRIRGANGAVYPTQGDHLFVIDPDSGALSGNPYDVSGNDALHYVAKLVNLGGKFHDLKIAPSGNELTLSPSSAATGFVTNPNKGYRAVVYGEGGFLKVVGDEEGRSPLPEGEWKLLSYTIDQTGFKEPEKPAEEAEKKAGEQADKASGSLLGVLLKAVTPSAPGPAQPRTGPTIVSARAKQDYKPVTVKKDETVELPFGPPYKPVVSAQYADQEERQVSLGLALVGIADEVCDNLMVNGNRPGKPRFSITTEDGKEVESGDFEYG